MVGSIWNKANSAPFELWLGLSLAILIQIQTYQRSGHSLIACNSTPTEKIKNVFQRFQMTPNVRIHLKVIGRSKQLLINKLFDLRSRLPQCVALSIKAYQKINFFENNSLTLKLICGWLSVKKQKKQN